MPQGVKGFQPGRQKTGGRVKQPVTAQRRSSKFVDQLKGYGFNYPRELAEVLLDLKRSGNDPGKLAELKFIYTELKSLLPYMAPKLREKEVDTSDHDDVVNPASAISTDDLLKAFSDDGKETNSNPSPSDTHPMGAGGVELSPTAGAETDLPDVDRIEGED